MHVVTIISKTNLTYSLMTRLKSQTPADVRLFNSRTSAGELCKSNQLFTAHLLGGDKFSYQLDSSTSKRFRFNKELNYKLAALEVFLPNRNAFAFVASLNIYCTSRRVIPRNLPLYYFAYLYLIDTKSQIYLVRVLQNQTVL